MTEIKLELTAPLAWVAALRDLHDQIDGASVSPLSQLADMIEEQVKPAIEEPTKFGSIVSAPLDGERVLWTPNPRVGAHYWISATGFSEVWSELTDVEVLRVGLGDVVDVVSIAIQGYSDAKSDALAKLRVQRSGAITSERKNALEKAIQAVEELAP